MFKSYRSKRSSRALDTAAAFEPLEPRTLFGAQPLVTLSIVDSLAAELNRDIAEFMIRRSGVLDEPLFVNYNIEGTATNGEDYLGLATTIRIPAGRRNVLIPIIPIDDLEVDGLETVRITLLSDSDYRLDLSNPLNVSLYVPILDDDNLPEVTVTAIDPNASEIGGADSSRNDTGRIRISRSGETTLPMVVNFRIRGSAIGGTDYEELPRSVTIRVGRRHAFLDIRPFNDRLFEGDETVRVILRPSTSNQYSLSQTDPSLVSTHAFIADKPFVGLIVTDPFGSQFPPDTASFTLFRTGDLSFALRCNYVLGGTATEGEDYARLAPVLTFPIGVSTITVVIRGLANSEANGMRTVRLTLRQSNDYNLNLGDFDTFSNYITILDNFHDQDGT